MSLINVAFAVDTNNLDQVGVVIASILAHATRPAELGFFILLDGPAAIAEQKIAGWAVRPPNLTVVPFDGSFAARVPRGHVSTAALLRTHLPKALPDLDRVVYLDADVIVRHDIAELFAADLGGKPMGGVVEMGVYLRLRRDTVRHASTQKDYLAWLGFDPDTSTYVNTGVLVMDLAALRALDFSSRAVAFSNERGPGLRSMDQCLINTILQGQIASIDPRWNACGHVINLPRHHHYVPAALRPSLRLQMNDPWIIHYTGAKKPWNSAEVWRAEDWWAHADKSGIAWGPRPEAHPEPLLVTALRSLTWGTSYLVNRVHPH